MSTSTPAPTSIAISTPVSSTIEISLDDVDRIAATFAPDQPVNVVNLIRFTAQADYSGTGNREALDLPAVSGEMAYFERYLPAFTAAVNRFGGCELAFGGRVAGSIVRADEPDWDAVIIGRYVNIHAYRDLVHDEGYRNSASHHRIASVAAARAYVTGDLA